jgi:hypothetical protein
VLVRALFACGCVFLLVYRYLRLQREPLCDVAIYCCGPFRPRLELLADLFSILAGDDYDATPSETFAVFWSGSRMGFAPTGKSRLFMAHTWSRHPGAFMHLGTISFDWRYKDISQGHSG